LGWPNIFSVLKLIKIDRQSSLGNDTLKDLLTLNTDGTSIKNLILTHALICGGKLKHKDQIRIREKYKKRTSQNIESETESSSNDDDTFLLEDWDNWLDDSEA